MYNPNIRTTTPPSYKPQTFYADGAESAYNNIAFLSSTDNSPESVITNITTPHTSPQARTIRSHGPPLLPKIRCQDQTTEPTSTAGSVSHGRAVSLASAHFSSNFAYPNTYNVTGRRGTSPLDGIDIHSPNSIQSLPTSALSSSISPASAMTSNTTPSSLFCHFASTPSPVTSQITSPIAALSATHDPRPQSVPTVRAPSLPASTAPPGHSRSGSTSSVDETAIRKYGYPTCRTVPQYITAAQVSPAAPAPAQLSFQQPNHLVSFASSSDLNSISADYTQVGAFNTETTNIISYLTEPNVSPSLVARSIGDHARVKDWYWWDVRNLRNWSDFNIRSILSIPQFDNLLSIPIPTTSLPQPQRTSPTPETEYALRHVYSDFFAVKVNAALQLTQGSRHLFMQAMNSATSRDYPKPDFISMYTNDYLKTLRGDQRGRLVGIVKAYDEWNTGMRAHEAPAQVKYLKGLSQLHRIMREHGTRYGFIFNEIELLCVRAGAEDDEYANAAPGATTLPDDGPKPIYGFLEIAAPIQLHVHGRDASGMPLLSAPLALWFLHMLAKEDPLPGMPPFKMDVGGPAAVTRQNCRERDPWMPKVGQQESRVAKRARGWVFPEEPFSRKEVPNRGRRN